MQVTKSELALGGIKPTMFTLLKMLSFKELFGGLSATYLKVIPAASISLLTRDALLGRLRSN